MSALDSRCGQSHHKGKAQSGRLIRCTEQVTQCWCACRHEGQAESAYRRRSYRLYLRVAEAECSLMVTSAELQLTAVTYSGATVASTLLNKWLTTACQESHGRMRNEGKRKLHKLDKGNANSINLHCSKLWYKPPTPTADHM